MQKSGGDRRIRVLTFSTLFPNERQPAHGVFVRTRLNEVVATGQVDAQVVAPVPWFPSRADRFGEYAKFAGVPKREMHGHIEVHHPRYIVLPKIGMRITPYTLAAGAMHALNRIRRHGFDFDLIDAHYFYPDGVAATILGRWLRRPVVITARGTDINLIPEDPVARRLILQAHRRSVGNVAVCQALKDQMVRIGMDPSKITVLRNGVDLSRFHPIERPAARRQLDMDGNWMLSVGLLIERKGHDIAIRALRDLPGWQLMIAGDGPLRSSLEALARDCGVLARVRFAGLVPPDELPTYYSAADLLVLASSREGWANVLLESMACGTPVVASPVWGTPEVVAVRAAGVLMSDRSPGALASAVTGLASDPPSRAATREYAEQFGWEFTTLGQLDLFRRVVSAAS
jgi:teichuronic acid biosynthesis glycosyltransferase TuaC